MTFALLNPCVLHCRYTREVDEKQTKQWQQWLNQEEADEASAKPISTLFENTSL